MVYPLKKALEYFPFPTIMLFVGFILGSFPSLFDNVKKELKPIGIVPFIISIAVPIVLCFISSGRDVNLSNTMEVYMYFVIILVGRLLPYMSYIYIFLIRSSLVLKLRRIQ